MSRIKVQLGQTLFDVALQHYGSLEGIKDLMRKNPTVVTSFEVELEGGQGLEVGEVIDQDVVDFLNERRSVPATGVVYTDVDPSEDSGVYAPEYSAEYS